MLVHVVVPLCAKAPVALRKRLGVGQVGEKVQENTYDTVRALGALAIDTTSAAAGVVCARVHGGGSGSCAEMQKARGAGEDQGRGMIAEEERSR